MNDELLSRMAETLFWTGRYIERADDTARLVDIYVHRLLGDAAAGSGADCGPLFGILGVDPDPDAQPDVGAALFRLAYDAKSPSAIAGAVLAARAGARGIREVISSEMWECLNVTAHGLSGQPDRCLPPRSCQTMSKTLYPSGQTLSVGVKECGKHHG